MHRALRVRDAVLAATSTRQDSNSASAIPRTIRLLRAALLDGQAGRRSTDGFAGCIGVEPVLKTYRQLYDLLDRGERRKTIIVFAILLVVALLEMVGVASILPFIAVLSNPDVVTTNAYLRWAYDAFGFTSTDSFLFWLGVAVFLVLIGSLAAKAASVWVQVRFADMRNHTIGARLLSRYLRQPYEWFLNRHSAGFATTILNEVEYVVNGCLSTAIHIVAHTLVALFLLALLIAIDPLLAATAAVVMGVVYTIVFGSVRNHLLRIGARRRTANDVRFKIVNEAFGGIKDVKIAGLEEVFEARFRAPSAEVARRNAAVKILQQLPYFAMQGLIFGGMLLVILYLMTSKGGFHEAVPTLALYAFAGYRLIPALQSIYKDLSMLRYAEPALDTLHKDLMSLSADTARLPATNRLGLQQQLELRDVHYAYPNAPRPALEAVHLTLPARTTVGLVGTTGSGKTTCVDVVLGLLPPSAGEVLVDGERVTAANVRGWQRSLGYVPQQIYLTDDTIAANIAFGVPPQDVDHAAVERAARIASLHDFIVEELPDGYATTVGERGIRLSGGQRQRIGIARALYHDPDVLIMDEATSALDNVTERAVMDAVHELGHKKTIILIAHRLSTVRDCDQIFVLEGGTVVASGTYDELVEGHEGFRAMAATSV
jgi:ATP-binding cassette, subfamily B, bacterial PglK